MPLLRYFTYVGGALIALLFVASYLFPEAQTVAHQDVTRPNIRITTDRVVPPRVDFDTSLQAAAPTLPPGVMLLQAPALQARAQLIAPHPAAGPVKTEAKNEPKNEIKRTRVARRTASYPHYAAYPYPYGYQYQPFRWTW